MINICVIEDKEDDYNEIIRHIKICGRNIRKQHGLEVNLSGIETPLYSFDEFIPILKEKEINILILDYELIWKDGRHFTGLGVLESILKNAIKLLFVFFTSGLFRNNSEYANRFVIDGYSEEFKSQTRPKEFFLTDEKISKTTELILNALPQIESKIEFDLFSYPLLEPDQYMGENSLLNIKSLYKEKSIEDCGIQKMSGDQIILIIISSCSKRFLLISLDSENSFNLQLINKVIKDYGPSDMMGWLDQHNMGLVKIKKIIFNPSYIEPYTDPEKKLLKFHLHAGSLLNDTAVEELIEVVLNEVDAIEARGEQDGKVKEACGELNPFYKSFVKIK
ncbi:MAG: hypothetical protein ACJA0U_000558 [Salibacteraceae bacterium]|jgi:hypothetical protein